MKNYDDMSDFEVNQCIARIVTDGDVIEFNDMAMGPSEASVQVIYKVGAHGEFVDYCNNPSDAWPIIVENKISINHDIARYSADSLVYSKQFDDGFKIFRHEGKMGDTSSRAALRAAMTCFLKMKDAE